MTSIGGTIKAHGDNVLSGSQITSQTGGKLKIYISGVPTYNPNIDPTYFPTTIPTRFPTVIPTVFPTQPPTTIKYFYFEY